MARKKGESFTVYTERTIREMYEPDLGRKMTEQEVKDMQAHWEKFVKDFHQAVIEWSIEDPVGVANLTKLVNEWEEEGLIGDKKPKQKKPVKPAQPSISTTFGSKVNFQYKFD